MSLPDSGPATVHIGLAARLGARLLRLAFPFAERIPAEVAALAPPGLGPAEILVPTRHGPVRCLVHRPPVRAAPPPVHLQFHGGAFIVRVPEQDEHLCRYLAHRAGAVVISVDYGTAPEVRYPVAEEQAYDVYTWVAAHGAEQGWDGSRVAAGGISSGAKFAVNLCQQARTAGHALPRALVSVYGALDMTLGLDGRTSARRNPAVPPWLVRLMYGTYFADASRRAEPLASPVLDAFAGFPPTLVLTAEFDTMTAENEHLADGLAAAGVAVRRAHYTGVDHGFLHLGPAPVTALAFEAVAGHLRAALHG